MLLKNSVLVLKLHLWCWIETKQVSHGVALLLVSLGSWGPDVWDWTGTVGLRWDMDGWFNGIQCAHLCHIEFLFYFYWLLIRLRTTAVYLIKIWLTTSKMAPLSWWQVSNNCFYTSRYTKLLSTIKEYILCVCVCFTDWCVSCHVNPQVAWFCGAT